MSLKRVNTPDGGHYFVDAKTGEKVDVTVNGKPKNPSTVLKKSAKSLKNLGGFIIFLGWILFVVSLFVFAFGFDKETSLYPLGIYGGIGGFVNSIFLISWGYMMTSVASLMVSGALIEETTEKSNNMLEELLRKSTE